MALAYQDNTPVRPRFYFVDEVATELRRSEAAVRWLIHTGQIKTGKIGGRVVVRPEDLDAFIDAGFSEAG